MSKQKYKNIHVRLKSHLSRITDCFENCKKVSKESNDSDSDFIISYSNDNLYFAFLFKYKNKDGEQLSIEDQTYSVFLKETNALGHIENYMSEANSIEDFKKKYNNYATEVGHSGVFFLAEKQDISHFALPFLLKHFLNIETNYHKEDLNKLDELLRPEINQMAFNTSEENKMDSAYQEKRDAYETEFNSLSNQKTINELESLLEDMREKEEALKENISTKHNIYEIDENHSEGKKSYRKRKEIFIKKAMSVASDNNLNILINDILEKT